MNLSERDNYIHQMETQLDSKKNAMFKKHTQLDALSKNNMFLHGVKEDYINYYDYLIKEKIDQINALKKIQEYITTMNTSLTKTYNTVSGFKNDEELIKKEILKIKSSIDKFINVTPDKYTSNPDNANLLNLNTTDNVSLHNPKTIDTDLTVGNSGEQSNDTSSL
jgi:hypothetical protein